MLLRSQVQNLLEESLPRVIGSLILSYLREEMIHIRTWEHSISAESIAYHTLSGEVIVADTGNNRICVFTPQGRLISTWGNYGNAPGQFKCPRGIALTPNVSLSTNEVVVADTDNHRIQVFNMKGEFLRMWGATQGWYGKAPGEFDRPYDVSVSPSGEIIVVEITGCRVQVFSSEGKFLRMWGKAGDKPGELFYPRSINIFPTSSSYEVVVADSYNHRIQVFTPKGKFLRMWGSEGDNPGEFDYPCGLSISSGGEIIVADANNHRIQIFDRKGKLHALHATPQCVFMWGEYGKEAGEFSCPGSVSVLPSGEIIVADTGNCRIQVFQIALV